MTPGRGSLGRRKGPPAVDGTWEPSDAEIHFLYWFIQGSIMIPETRWRLRRAWGMCDRHAWGALAVEASYRPSFFHGPAILYGDLLERATAAFALAGPWKGVRLARALRPTAPCMMCEMGYGPGQPAGASRELIEGGRNWNHLRAFAARTEPWWGPTVCGRCLGNGSRPRCRPHLREDARHGAAVDVAWHRASVEDLLRRLRVYGRSFVWGHQHTQTDEGRASLLSAVGWCSGWRTFRLLMEGSPREEATARPGGPCHPARKRLLGDTLEGHGVRPRPPGVQG